MNVIAVDFMPTDAVCTGRVGILEFGPFTVQELSELAASHSLPDDLEIRVGAQPLWWSWPRIIAGRESSAVPAVECLTNWFTRIGESIAGPFSIVDLTNLILAGGVPTTVTVQVGDGPWRRVSELMIPPESTSNFVLNDQVPVLCGTSSAKSADGHSLSDIPRQSGKILPVEDHLPQPERVFVANPASPVRAGPQHNPLVTSSVRPSGASEHLVTAPPAETCINTLPVDRKKQELETWLNQTMPQRVVSVRLVAREPVRPIEQIVAAALERAVLEIDDVAEGLKYPQLWGGLGLVGVVSLILLFWPTRTVDDLDVHAFHKLKSALEMIQAVRDTHPDVDSWNDFSKSIQQDLATLELDLERAQTHRSPIKETLFWALKYRMPKILADGRIKASSSERAFQDSLREAERLISTERSL